MNNELATTLQVNKHLHNYITMQIEISCLEAYDWEAVQSRPAYLCSGEFVPVRHYGAVIDVQFVERGHVLGLEREVKHVQVLFDVARCDGLGDDNQLSLQRPANANLSRCFVVLGAYVAHLIGEANISTNEYTC